MFDLSLGGMFLLVLALFMLMCIILYLALVLESGKLSLGLEELKTPERKPTTRPATWRDGALAIGIDMGKYDKYAGALIERYPLAMDNLIKLEWLSVDMNEEEKYRVRREYELKFDEVVRDEDQRQRERMSEEIESVMEGFKESGYVSSTDENKV